MSRTRTDCEGFHRRDVLRVGVAGLLGLSLPDALRAEALNPPDPRVKKPATGVIQIWLSGGPATIDMWDLKPDAPEGIRGDFKPIETSAKGISISEHLPKMAKVIDRSTIVRSIYHPIPSHGTATVWMTTGNKPTPALAYPALGSLTSRLMPGTAGGPKFVSFGEMRNGLAGTAGFLSAAYNPFIIDGAGN